MSWFECKIHGLTEIRMCSKCTEVDICPVCEGVVDPDKSARCSDCGEIFCWTGCGGWGSADAICDNCTKKD